MEPLLYKSLKGMSEETQKRLLQVKIKNENLARERIFKFVLESDPSFGIGFLGDL